VTGQAIPPSGFWSVTNIGTIFRIEPITIYALIHRRDIPSDHGGTDIRMYQHLIPDANLRESKHLRAILAAQDIEQCHILKLAPGNPRRVILRQRLAKQICDIDELLRQAPHPVTDICGVRGRDYSPDSLVRFRLFQLRARMSWIDNVDRRWLDGYIDPVTSIIRARSVSPFPFDRWCNHKPDPNCPDCGPPILLDKFGRVPARNPYLPQIGDLS